MKNCQTEIGIWHWTYTFETETRYSEIVNFKYWTEIINQIEKCKQQTEMELKIKMASDNWNARQRNVCNVMNVT